MKVVVYGLWHLGSVTAAALSHLGHEVVGVDEDNSVIENLSKGKAPLFEPDLNEFLAKSLDRGNLKFLTNIGDALTSKENPDYLWITFDTPIDDEDRADTDFICHAITKHFSKMASFLKERKKSFGILISSQVPLGFTKKLSMLWNQYLVDVEKGSSGDGDNDLKLFFAVSPENLRLGKALPIFLNPDRIVVGVHEDGKEEGKEDGKKYFQPLIETITKNQVWMSAPSAEMTKHAINSFLGVSITFANELAQICEEYGANMVEVSKGLMSESRIGPKAYLKAGQAFAGGTLARDVEFLKLLALEKDLNLEVIPAIKKSNNLHKKWILNKCRRIFQVDHNDLENRLEKGLKNKKVLFLGLTYRPDTNTLRRSLALELIEDFVGEGSKIYAYDPMIKQLPLEFHDRCHLLKDFESIKTLLESKIDIILVTTECREFKENFPDQIYELFRGCTVIDPGRFLEERIQKVRDVDYYSIGYGC